MTFKSQNKHEDRADVTSNYLGRSGSVLLWLWKRSIYRKPATLKRQVMSSFIQPADGASCASPLLVEVKTVLWIGLL